jgi:hypothetical protein
MTDTDGKFRVHRCKIVGKKDLSEMGLIDSKLAEEAEKGGGDE